MEINVNPFSKASIERAIKELENYKAKLERMNNPTNEVKSALIDRGVEKAQQKAPVVSSEDGSMAFLPIRGTEDGIVAGGDSYFVEFGTGIVGEQSPHPSGDWLAALQNASPPYNQGYNTGKSIIHSNKVNPATGYTDYWFYDHGKHVTSGIPSQHFLYDTAQELRGEMASIVKDVLDGKGQDK